MSKQLFYVDKTTNTSADHLLAVGFASFLAQLLENLERESKGTLIHDVGSHYEISVPTLISNDDLQRVSPFALLKPLFTTKQNDKRAGEGKALDGFDYETQQQQAKDYREKVKQLPPQLQRPDARWSNAPELEAIAYLKPQPELGLYQAIQQMKIASSFNELVTRWNDLTDEQIRLHCVLLFKLFGQANNDLATAIADWQKMAKEQRLKGKASVTALQIINPTTGKGANRTKASELAIGNQDGFWLLELLKFVGFMHAAAPFIIRGSKDRKTYVLQPKKIELSTLQGIMREFREICWSSTAVKLDIIASLRFAQVFVKHRKRLLKAEKANEEIGSWDEPQLISVTEGFEVTFYKDMGSAFATMNVASINLPAWLPRIASLEQAQDAEDILNDHISLIRRIRNSKGEEGSEEFELLRFYRDFLSGRDLRPFWKFTTAYSGYYISALEKNRHDIQQLTINGLEKLMAHQKDSKKLTTITSNEGFKRIAYAIRQSTVTAQYRHAQLNDRTYEIRYGLGQELTREASYRDKFTATLAQFLHRYSAETAREEEKVANRLGGRKLIPEERRAYHLRSNIADTDLDEVVALIDEFGSELVCSLLIAYGYARDNSYRGGSSETTENTTASQETVPA